MTSINTFRAWILFGLILVPLIPTAIIYVLLKGKANKAYVKGSLFGLRLETAGAAGCYVICVVIALLVYSKVFVDQISQIQIVISASGDPSRVDRFLSDAASKSRLILTKSDGTELRVEHFDVNLDKRILRSDLTVAANDLYASYKPAFLYGSQRLTVTSATVTLSETLGLTVDFGGSSAGQWVAISDMFSYSFRNGGSDLSIHEVMLLQHESATPLESIPLHSYLDLGQLVFLEVGARSLSRDACRSSAQQWSRDSVGDQPPEVTQADFDSRFSQYKRQGDELAIRRFTNSDHKLPGQGERFQRGNVSFDEMRVMPTIGPIGGGIDMSRCVLVYAESWRRVDADSLRKGHEVSTGETFERPTDHVLLMVGSDASYPIEVSSTRTAFKVNLLTPVSKLGNSRIYKGTSGVAVDLTKVNTGDIAQLFWSWK